METRTETPTRQPTFVPPTQPGGALAKMREVRRALGQTPSEQAFRILHAGFVAAPVIAGLDKFTCLLADWDDYLAPQVKNALPISGHTFMQAVGVVEVAAGLLTAVKPKIGGYVVGAWLGGIIGNLLLGRHHYDIALRDFGLLLAAIALGRLAASEDRGELALPQGQRVV